MGKRPPWPAALGLVAAVMLAPVATARAAPTPERENDATDELLGGQVSSDELDESPPPKPKSGTSSEPKKDTPAKTTPDAGPAGKPASTGSPPNAPGFVAPPDPADSNATQTAGTSEGGDAKAAKNKNKSDDGPKDPGMSHHNQGMITVMPGWGFSAIVPYQDDIFCGEFSDDPGSDTKRKSFCTMASPWFMEFTGGFGVHPRVDVVLGLRVHLTKRDFDCRDGDDPTTCKGMFNRKVAVGLAPGIRAWISQPERKFKIGGAVDFIWLHESFQGYRERDLCQGPDDDENGPCPILEGPIEPEEQDIKDDDIGFRLGPVIQIDPHRNVGIVILPAARMGLLRWFEFSFDLGIGIQARFP